MPTLEGVEKISFLDFALTLSDPAYDPLTQIRDYITVDFASFVKKQIVPVSLAGWEAKRKGGEISFTDEEYFKTLLAPFSKDIILTGSIKVVSRTTSVIRTVSDPQGGKKNAFVNQQLWDVDAQIVFLSAATGKVILQHPLKENITWEEKVSSRFQYERVLEKLTERMVFDFQKRRKRENRYLILR